MKIMPASVTEHEMTQKLKELNRIRVSLKKLHDPVAELTQYDTLCVPLLRWFEDHDITVSLKKGPTYYISAKEMARLGFGHRPLFA